MTPIPRPELALEQRLSVGLHSGCGNLVGIQPCMVPQDYRSPAHLSAKLAGYLETAREEGWLQERTVAVFPEHIGTWLVAAGERDVVYQAKTVTEAMRLLLLNNLIAFLRWLPSAVGKASDVVRFTLFRTKAEQMAQHHHQIFAGLAREYRVTVVAGSIVLSSPAVKGGLLVPGNGPLYNVSLVYRPDGSPYEGIVRKAFPTSDELPFTQRGSVEAIPVFDTPAGRLGVLICADSWQPACYQAFGDQQIDLLAVPSFLGPDDVWDQPWKGYSGAPPPADVDLRDIGKLTEGQAWSKYALPGRISAAGAQWGINVFLRGSLWDLGSDGHAMIVHRRRLTQLEPAQSAALVNVWFDHDLTEEIQ